VQTHNEGGDASGQGSDKLYGVENVIGSPYDDVISGNRDRNTFSGGAGDDSLSGYDQTDVLLGGSGNDTLDGGPGRDVLDGGNGQDTCAGGEDKKSCERKGPVGAVLLLGALARFFLAFRRRRLGS
jgi:Ca2+-binding RTX toxin-like protein